MVSLRGTCSFFFLMFSLSNTLGTKALAGLDMQDVPLKLPSTRAILNPHTRDDLRTKYGKPLSATYGTQDGRLVTDPNNSPEFREKYGQPVSETFQAQPGVFVTANYEADGRFTEIEIALQSSPKSKDLNQDVTNDEAIRKMREQFDILGNIADDLVPSWERGESIIIGFNHVARLPNDPPLLNSYEEYENVTILNYSGGGVPPFKVIRWKRREN